jgi:hypothetical protein
MTLEAQSIHFHASYVIANDTHNKVSAASSYIRRHNQRDISHRSPVVDASSYLRRLDDHDKARAEVTGADFFCIGNLPRDVVWRDVDRAARNKNGQYSRRGGNRRNKSKPPPFPRLAIFIDANFPYSMSEEQKIRVGREMAQRMVNRDGCAVEIAFHKKPGVGIDHVHFLVSMRRVDESGVKEMIRALNGIASTCTDGIASDGARGAGHAEWMRSSWADLLTEATGLPYDHRSFLRQGIDIIPEKNISMGIIKAQQRAGNETWKLERAARMAARTRAAEPYGAARPAHRQSRPLRSNVGALVAMGMAARHRQQEHRFQSQTVASFANITSSPRGRDPVDAVANLVARQWDDVHRAGRAESAAAIAAEAQAKDSGTLRIAPPVPGFNVEYTRSAARPTLADTISSGLVAAGGHTVRILRPLITMAVAKSLELRRLATANRDREHNEHRDITKATVSEPQNTLITPDIPLNASLNVTSKTEEPSRNPRYSGPPMDFTPYLSPAAPIPPTPAAPRPPLGIAPAPVPQHDAPIAGLDAMNRQQQRVPGRPLPRPVVPMETRNPTIILNTGPSQTAAAPAPVASTTPPTPEAQLIIIYSAALTRDQHRSTERTAILIAAARMSPGDFNAAVEREAEAIKNSGVSPSAIRQDMQAKASQSGFDELATCFAAIDKEILETKKKRRQSQNASAPALTPAINSSPEQHIPNVSMAPAGSASGVNQRPAQEAQKTTSPPKTEITTTSGQKSAPPPVNPRQATQEANGNHLSNQPGPAGRRPANSAPMGSAPGSNPARIKDVAIMLAAIHKRRGTLEDHARELCDAAQIDDKMLIHAADQKIEAFMTLKIRTPDAMAKHLFAEVAKLNDPHLMAFVQTNLVQSPKPAHQKHPSPAQTITIKTPQKGQGK